MSSLFFYRARVETTKGREMIPVFAFKSGDATPVWPDINVKSLADLQMITSMADGARALTICTYTYLVNRAFPGRDVSFFELAVHDAWDTKSPPTSERRIVAMITGRDMSVPHKHTINFKL